MIVVSLDTTRADHLGCYGNPWIRTPNLDRLAEQSILFSNHMTVVPTTLASHTSLFTGTYPHHHGVARNGFRVHPNNLLLAELLTARGYRTAAFLSSFALHRRFGMDQGFAHYEHRFGQGADGEARNRRNAAEVTDSVVAYLETLGEHLPLFLFVHYFDPHQPYTSGHGYSRPYQWSWLHRRWFGRTQRAKLERSASRSKARRYAGEISYMDHHLGRLLRELEARGILDQAVLVVSSDHGESFLEHRQPWNHGAEVYQTTMQSVLLIRLPGAHNAGTRVIDLVGNIDIMPTLLTSLSVPVPAGVDGAGFDLRSDMLSIPQLVRFGQATQPWSESVEAEHRWPNRDKARCVREGAFKYVQTPHLGLPDELYDLSRDPYEKNNLLAGAGSTLLQRAENLRLKLERWAESADPLGSELDERDQHDTIERLRALGYVQAE